jgi:hypothetical protein
LKKSRAVSDPALLKTAFLIRVISSSSRRKWIPGTPHDLFSPETLAQLPQLTRYFDRNLLILHNPKKKVVTTNYVL